VFGHVAHLAVLARVEPAVEMPGIGIEFEVTDAECVESTRLGQSQQGGLEVDE
jgi:hypothetical protein